MIKIIGFDLDDTLLDSNKNILDLDAVRLAIDNGVKIVLCSGRPFSLRTEEYYKELGIDEGYFCGYNGTVIYDIKTKQIIYENSLDKNELFFIMNIVKAGIEQIKDQYDMSDVAVCIHTNGNVYTNHINKFIDLEVKLNKNKAFIDDYMKWDNLSAYKLMIDAEPEIINALANIIMDKLNSKFNVMISMPCFIEVIKKDSSKYNGLKEVARMYGIKEDEIMGFGDSMNDYELVRDSYVGIAMANGNDEVKKVASFVTDTNDNHGIRKALEKYNVI